MPPSPPHNSDPQDRRVLVACDDHTAIKVWAVRNKQTVYDAYFCAVSALLRDTQGQADLQRRDDVPSPLKDHTRRITLRMDDETWEALTSLRDSHDLRTLDVLHAACGYLN